MVSTDFAPATRERVLEVAKGVLRGKRGLASIYADDGRPGHVIEDTGIRALRYGGQDGDEVLQMLWSGVHVPLWGIRAITDWDGTVYVREDVFGDPKEFRGTVGALQIAKSVVRVEFNRTLVGLKTGK